MTLMKFSIIPLLLLTLNALAMHTDHTEIVEQIHSGKLSPISLCPVETQWNLVETEEYCNASCINPRSNCTVAFFHYRKKGKILETHVRLLGTAEMFELFKEKKIGKVRKTGTPLKDGELKLLFTTKSYKVKQFFKFFYETLEGIPENVWNLFIKQKKIGDFRKKNSFCNIQ